MTITRTTFEKMYRAEKNTRIRERMLLVLNVPYYDKVATHVARDSQEQRLDFPMVKEIQRRRYGRIKRQAKKWKASKDIQTDRIPNKDHSKGK